MDSMPLTICTVVTFFVHIDKDPLEIWKNLGSSKHKFLRSRHLSSVFLRNHKEENNVIMQRFCL